MVSATLANDTSKKAVSWSASGGTFSSDASASGASVTYTAPSTPGIYTITATQSSDVTQRAVATIGVTDLHGVYTYHNDVSRDGANTSEYALTTANVNSSTFGKLFSCQADAAIYTQPLWVSNSPLVGRNTTLWSSPRCATRLRIRRGRQPLRHILAYAIHSVG